jgi:3',5'-cyclic AMP phosphodiesterase CpdA
MGDLYGAFDYGNSHFVQLNSCSVEADGTVHDADFDAEQLAWLENDLQAHQSAANIFVFFHHYPFGPVDDNPKLDSGLASIEVRNKMHAIFVKYHVRAVFAGHNHRYYHTTKDGVDYYISGGAGAPLDATPQEGGYLHYMLIHVDGASTNIDVLQPWHLFADSVASDCVHVANYQPVDVDVNNVVFRLPALPAGQKYAATATVGYKKKTKPAEATVVSVTPVAGTQLVDVAVATRCVKARTTRITVTAAP